MKVCAALPTSCWTGTKRRNSLTNQSKQCRDPTRRRRWEDAASGALAAKGGAAISGPTRRSPGLAPGARNR
jgi:hypothetical protein